MYPNEENMIAVCNNKKNKDYQEYQVYLVSQMNFDYNEYSGKKSISCQTKESISCIPMRRTYLECAIAKRMVIIMSIQV